MLLAVPFRPALRHVLALVALLPGSGRSSVRTKIHRPETIIYLINRVLNHKSNIIKSLSLCAEKFSSGKSVLY